MTVAARQLFKGVRPHDHISATALEKSKEFKIPGIFGIPRVQGFTLYGVGFWGLIEIV